MDNRDFERDLYNLLGVGFDAIDMDGAVKAVTDAISEKRKLFISTPNLNFLIAAQANESFRDSVINSDLSIADGMPIVFMCKLLDIPIRERVAGSSLIDALRRNEDCIKKPIKVFFFGGQDGIAEKAHKVLNEEKRGLVSAGYLNPGFGTVQEMSRPEIIDEINKANPDFVIVSLGAAKGQEWIEKNRIKLDANVISHLGAVVNFIAGNVKRAPDWVQNFHLEWLWRIKEEPGLFGRYWHDGLSFLKLLATNVLAYRRIIRNKPAYSTPRISVDDDNHLINLKGSLTQKIAPELRVEFERLVTQNCDFTVDMKGVTYIDQSTLGLLLILWKKMTEIDRQVSIIGVSKQIAKILELNKLSFMVTGK